VKATTTPASTAAAAVAMATDRNTRLDVQRPPDVDLDRPALLSVQYGDQDDLYDRIASPTYVVMGRTSATSYTGNRTSQPTTAADTATGRTSHAT